MLSSLGWPKELLRKSSRKQRLPTSFGATGTAGRPRRADRSAVDAGRPEPVRHERPGVLRHSRRSARTASW